jgi:hypothetical protein
VSKVGKILAKTEPLKALALPDDLVQADYAQWQQHLQAAVSAFDDRALEQPLRTDFSAYPLSVVFQDILMPLWQQLLQRQDAFGQTSEWLFLRVSCGHGFTHCGCRAARRNRASDCQALPVSAVNSNCWWPRCF